jgi:hypothetical protein
MRLELTWAQAVHLGLVRRLMPVMNRVIRASPSQADEHVAFVTADVLREDALPEIRLFYISAVACAWVVPAFSIVLAMVVVGIPAEFVFGDDVQGWILALLASVISACALPAVASPWFRQLAKKAVREARKPGADPARIRRLSSRALPGGGLLLAQVVVARVTLPVSLSTMR